MKLALALAALSLTSSLACTRSSGGEDDAYDLVKSRAAKDLSCSDITVRKMAQDGNSYEYQATGCDDIYTYGVDCDASCEVVAGVRGKGLGGLWNAADKFIGGIANDIERMEKDKKEMDERHRKATESGDRLRERVDAELERTAEALRQQDARRAR